VSRLNNTLESTRVGLNSFRKYIPSEVVTEVLSHQLEAIVEVKRKELTVLFTDFEGFTQMSEGMEPSELVELLNVYFEAIGLAVSEFNGTLDKFIGDAVMAFWNAPNDIPNHAEQACRAAHMIVKRIAAINAERVRNGKVGLNIRVGVHTGIAMVGNIGHEKRLNYTAMGDNVNMASRLEALNKEFGTNLLVSGDTAQRLGSGFNLRHVGDVVLKGKSENTAVFEILEIDARLV
jgi:adenylate cyclase